MPRSRACQRMPIAKSGETRSPSPGMSPRMGSRPKRIDVPGTSIAESSMPDTRRSTARRCSWPGVSCRSLVTGGRFIDQLPTSNSQLPTKLLATSDAWALGIGSCELGVLLLESPSQQQRSNREPGADGNHQHQIPAIEPLVRDRVVQRERDRRGCGIAEPLDVDDDFLLGNAQFFGGGQDNPAIRLMRD